MTLHRRDVLKGISLGAGSLVLSPMLANIKAHAAGQKINNKRFVFVVESNGLPTQQVTPDTIKRPNRQQRALNGPPSLVDIDLKDHKLPFCLEELEPWKDRMTIVHGLSGRVAGGGHSNNFQALGAFGAGRGNGGESKDIQETIDGALAKQLPGIFPHVGIGISKRVENSILYNISTWDTNKALPTMCKPDQAYAALFGSVAGGSAQEQFVAKNNLLDFLKDDVKKIESSLAGPERQQLSAYLETFETLRNRQSRLNEIKHTLREQAPVTNDKYTSKVETDRLDAQFDVGAAALIAGLTNVMTISSAAGNRDFDICFTGLGFKKGKHNIGHGGSENGKTWYENGSIIRKYHFDLIAGLIKKLEAVPEGDGTMLDNTVIIYLSDGAESHHSRCWEWPMVVIGNIDGKLKTGRYLDFPGYAQPKHRTISNMYTTLLQLAGSDRQFFGDQDPVLKDIDQYGILEPWMA